jgi:hypothetical protein
MKKEVASEGGTVGMFFKIKRWFGSEQKEELREVHRTATKSEASEDAAAETPENVCSNCDADRYAVHMEFFLYNPKSQEQATYTEQDIHRYPMMGFTLHFLNQKTRQNRPDWLTWLLGGLEKTLETMKVSYYQMDETELYSLFIDLKLYPQTEVKKLIYLVFQQLYQWYARGNDQVSVRVHIGGDELYQELLAHHLEAV